MEYQVCRLSELEERKPLTVDFDGLEIGVILSKGEIYAFENFCTHFGGPVCLGDVFARIKLQLNEQKQAVGEYVDEDELLLSCPWHAYEFDLKTGKCIVNPKQSLRKFPAYVKDDHVYVKVED